MLTPNDFRNPLGPIGLLFPGLGVSSMFGRVGSIVSPFIGRASALAPWAPLAIFGISALVSGALMVFLPETRGVELPDTIREAESRFGVKRKKEIVKGGEEGDQIENERSALLQI